MKRNQLRNHPRATAIATPRVRLLVSLVWITCVHAAGLYLFTTGFFLTRFEVPDVSECGVPPTMFSAASTAFSSTISSTSSHLRSEHGDLPSSSPSSSAAAAAAATAGCWMPRRFRRVIFVVIDALRFDFVAPSSSSRASSSFYLNHLPILNTTLHAQPENALLLKFIADPPTMTMQRLKGLTTGSLPTFLDIKDNMASTAITEDNLLRQMHDAQRPIVFMGDDTWDALYEPLFTRKYAYDSFNVKDLHSVDQGVIRHLFPELQQHDWDLLIAHFLGVDHVGHTHGPSSPFMTEKLDEMNAVLTKLIQELEPNPDNTDDDTLLLVMGDHGMSADGNHGGASDDETGAALFVYSNSKTSRLVDPSIARATQPWSDEVPQVDLVPTLALLTGLPIPFGSLGAVIPQLFSDKLTLLKALRLNVAQVRRYLLTYSAASKLPESDYDHLERMYEEISALEKQQQEREQGDDVELLVRKYHLYLREALALGRSIWTQFDTVGMGWGIALLMVSQALLVIAMTSASLDLQKAAVGAVCGAVIAAVGGVVPLGAVGFLPRLMLPRMLALGALGSCMHPLVHTLSSLFHSLHVRKAIQPRSVDSSSLVAFVTVLLHTLALLSNSFIVAEANVMRFLTTTIGFFLIWFAQRHAPAPSKPHAVVAAVVFLLVSRVSSAVDPPNIIQSTTSITRTWLPLVWIVVGIVGVVSIAQRSSRRGFLAPFVTATTPVVCAAIACGLYWHLAPIVSSFWRLWLPRSVFLLLLGAFVRRAHVAYSSSSRFLEGNVSFAALLALAYSLVLGATSPLTILLVALAHVTFVVVARLCHATSQEELPVAWGLLWCNICLQSFFTTGHQNTFTSLQNAAGFVGLDDFHFYWAGALLGFNTFGNYALALLAVVPFVGRPATALLTVVGYFALNALVSTAFVALQRRHLMVWAIFAPKFIFDGATLLIVELLAIVTAATIVTPQDPQVI